MMQTVQLSDLPVILLGPILRRVDPRSVSVMFALRASKKITLRIYSVDQYGNLVMVLEGTRATVELARHVHVVTVTASGAALESGALYYYQAYFGAHAENDDPVPATAETMFSPGMFVAERDPQRAKAATEKALTYQIVMSAQKPLPSFATPPDDLNQLRIFHGSCRKPHGGGGDMLGQLDRVIGPAVTDPQRRPHQLLLTGDQIYADDVADTFLAAIEANVKLLGFRAETLPNHDGSVTIDAEQLKPGRRQGLLAAEAKFTSGESKSHVVTFAEYAVMYLMVWSDVLWPGNLPRFEEVYPQEAALLVDDSGWGFIGDVFKGRESRDPVRALRSVFEGEAATIAGFRAELPAVRRAMANVPVLTICDDHDVTDDWNMTLEWCRQVVLPTGSKLGRRVVTNAMLAYAYFQAWGNTPEQFASTGQAGEPGRKIIAHTQQWNRADDAHLSALGELLALPSGLDVETVDGIATTTLRRPANALSYHYWITWTSYQLVVLDTRTWRSFPGGPQDPPALVWSDESMDAMLTAPGDLGPDAATVIVSPAVVVGVPLLEEILQPAYKRRHGVYAADIESWSAVAAAYHKFLARCLQPGTLDQGGTIRRNVVLLSGDVHYGFAASAHYRGAKPYVSGNAPISGTVAQLVSSSLHNQDNNTKRFHAMGYVPGRDSVPTRVFLGWANEDGRPPTIERSAVSDETSNRDVLEGEPADRPHWRVTIQYLKQDAADPSMPARPGDPQLVTSPNVPREAALAQYIAASKERHKYLGSWGHGKEVVGLANFGEVTFGWTNDPEHVHRRKVFQTLWWRLPGVPADGVASAPPGPLTTYAAPLDGITTAMAKRARTRSAPLRQTAPQAERPAHAEQAAPAEPSYGGFILRDGDRDGTPPSYDGAQRPDAVDGHVRALQADLLELGFALLGTADGHFGRGTRWAVREFQTYAKGTHVARDRQLQPRAGRYVDNLEQAELPQEQRYTGPVSGVVDNDTALTIALWRRNRWRCPVVIEAWTIAAGQPQALHQIPADGDIPARSAENLWRYDEVQSTAPRMYAIDFSERYQLPPDPDNPGQGRPPDVQARPELRVLGQWQRPLDPASGWSGPVALARHTWREAEMLPERLLPVPPTGEEPTLGNLTQWRIAPQRPQQQREHAARQLSTYKVVRAVAELEALGYFDVYNSWDSAFLSCGPCHWTVGPAVTGRGDAARWAVAAGELWAFLAYLRSVDEPAYEQMTADYGLGVDREWGLNGQRLWDAGQRKYTARPTLTDEHSAAIAVPALVAEFDMFRNWHWVYRIAMAGRAVNYAGWRRAMWTMARQRINDISRAGWNVAGSFQVADIPLAGGGSRQARIGDVFTSERCWGMLLRWHVNRPSHIVRNGRSGARARGALDRARTQAPNLDWAGAPSTWGNAHETALVNALSAESATVNATFDEGTNQVRDWPTWTAARNPRRYSLPIQQLGADERNLLTARDSFRFDDSALAGGV